MRVFYDAEKTKEIEERLWKTWGNREKEWAKSGYNVSECSNCELKCFCQRTGIQQKPTKQNIGFLIFGIVSEFVVMSIYPDEQRQYEANLNEQIFGHMDVYEEFAYPIEGKATAKRIFKADQLPIQWIMQLSNYLTMSKGNKGWLLILDIFTRNMSAFCIEMEPDDKLRQIELLMDKVNRFNKAISTNNTSELFMNPSEYDLCHFKHECPRRLECKAKNKEQKK